MALTTRAGSGALITQAEGDANWNTLNGVVESVTGTTHTIDHTDENKTIEYNNASPIAVTLTAVATINSSNDSQISNLSTTLKNIGAGLVTATCSGADTMEDGTTSFTIPQYQWFTIQTNSAGNGWIVLSFSNLNNPAFTGVPTAPTAAADTNTTQIATTAFVTTEDNLKADIASPTLTGVPAAPTAAPATNTTQISTTAFVEAAVNAHNHIGGDGAAIAQGAMAAAAIGQAELKTSTGIVSKQGIALNIALPGGEYGFYPRTRSGNAFASGEVLAQIAGGDGTIPSTSFICNIFLGNEAAAQTGFAQQRYLTASPPYDLGDGEIPLFVFALIDNTTGDVVATYSAPEAPWHYNGPTDIRADFYDSQGIGFKRVKDEKEVNKLLGLSGNVGLTKSGAKGDIGLTRAYAEAYQGAPLVPVEITQGIKQADMPLIPRPMEPGVGQSVVMLNPLSPITLQLYEAGDFDGDFNFSSLLHSGNLSLSNIPMGLSGPPGVDVVDFSWRNTPR